MASNRIINPAWLVAACMGLCGQVLADGLTFYVRQGGNDLSGGLTPDSALHSIQRAVALALGPGNSIVVGPGVYYEQVLVGTGPGAGAGNGTAGDPNVIIADLTGALTGDDAAPVIIEGDGVRECGLRINDRDHWAVNGLTFRGQTQRGIHIKNSVEIDVESCTIYAPSDAGIEAEDCDELIIAGNMFVRDISSGSIIIVEAAARRRAGRLEGGWRDERNRGFAWGYYKRNRGVSGETVVIEANRFAMVGELYLGSDYGRDERGRHGRGRARVYGISAEVRGEEAAVHILNNVGSDCSRGISLQLLGEDASAVIANNSLAGCWIGIEAIARDSELLISDNIIAHSKHAIAAPNRHLELTISGLLTFDLGGSVVLGRGPGTIAGHLQNVDPRWVAPGAGNFALSEASPAIDSGLGAGGLLVDIRGLSRPCDGDGDGNAASDLGAYEYHPEEDGHRRLQLVEWREIEAHQP